MAVPDVADGLLPVPVIVPPPGPAGDDTGAWTVGADGPCVAGPGVADEDGASCDCVTAAVGVIDTDVTVVAREFCGDGVPVGAVPGAAVPRHGVLDHTYVSAT